MAYRKAHIYVKTHFAGILEESDFGYLLPMTIIIYYTLMQSQLVLHYLYIKIVFKAKFFFPFLMVLFQKDGY